MRKYHIDESLDDPYDPSYTIKMFERLEFYDQLSVRLYIWDLPGKPDYDHVTNQYLTNADAAIIMYDTTNPKAYSDTERILNKIMRLKSKDDFCCILFGNKNDLQHKRSVGIGKMMKLAQKYDIELQEGSIKEDFNIDKMFYSLTAQCIDELYEIEE